MWPNLNYGPRLSVLALWQSLAVVTYEQERLGLYLVQALLPWSQDAVESGQGVLVSRLPALYLDKACCEFCQRVELYSEKPCGLVLAHGVHRMLSGCCRVTGNRRGPPATVRHSHRKIRQNYIPIHDSHPLQESDPLPVSGIAHSVSIGNRLTAGQSHFLVVESVCALEGVERSISGLPLACRGLMGVCSRALNGVAGAPPRGWKGLGSDLRNEHHSRCTQL